MVALAVIAAALIESVVREHTVLTSHTVGGVGVGLMFLARRRLPLLVGLGVLGVIAAGAVVGGPLDTDWDALILASLLAGWTLGRELPLVPAMAGCALGLALVAVHTRLIPAADRVNEAVAIASVAGCWLAGAAFRRWGGAAQQLRARAEQVRSLADAEVRRAVANERSRLARELHDVVSHTVTVMTLQAGGARMLLDSDPERASDAIRSVEECGREALGELRRMGRMLPSSSGAQFDPAPGLSRLDELLARVRAAGLHLSVDTTGRPDSLSPGLDVTVYRIVQEALTNALRHGAGRAHLSIAYDNEGIRVEVSNVTQTPTNNAGRGLIGLRERAAMYGGSFTAHRVADGCFVQSAWLPNPT